MRQNVLHLVRSFLERFLTDRTDVGIDLAVDSHVLVQSGFVEEGLSARGADVGVQIRRDLLGFVPADVRLQGG